MLGVAGAEVFRETIRALESGLQVRHIASALIHRVHAEDPIARVHQDPVLAGFDHHPVWRGGRLVGVLHRGESTGEGTTESRMRGLHEVPLVPAGMSLAEFLPIVRDHSFALVLLDHDTFGIVTRSDLQKLPVRLLAFALITHLEMQMADRIRATFPPPSEAWMGHLSEGRRASLLVRWENLRKKAEELDLVEATEFCDKREVISAIDPWNSGDMGRFKTDLKAIEVLRNQLAHANTSGLEECVEQMLTARKWIERFGSLG